MEVVYKKPILEKILEAKEKALTEMKVIEKIILTKAEMEAVKNSFGFFMYGETGHEGDVCKLYGINIEEK